MVLVPRKYGPRRTRRRAPNIATVDEENGMATGVDGDGVRVLIARSWMEGSEVGRGGDLYVGGDLEDLDDQLFHLIQDVPAPWTVARLA